MSIYLHYDGIKGNATQGQHKDWININSFQWGVGRGISTAVGRAQNRETSEPSISEVVVSKELDAASAMLLQEAMIGKDGKTVKIDFCRTDKEGSPYLQIILTNTLISGFSASSGGDAPSESISLNFTKVEFNESGPNEKNGAGQPVKVSYDLATAGT